MTAALATPAAGSPFELTTIERREVGEHDVLIDVAYCGICHSDIHQAREEWGTAIFPMVPGHEIAGTVAEVGSAVTRIAVGDHVGVGCFVDSCRECENCVAGEEQYCLRGMVATYNGRFPDGTPTYGGYSRAVVVDEAYALRIPDSIELSAAAPLLCAGITTYSPLRHWGAGPGKHVAVVGLGGLGHLAVQIAHALGAEVTVLSQSLKKQEDGLRLGADHYHATDDVSLKSLRNSFDLIINTVSADLPYRKLIGTLRLDGAMVNVGIPPSPAEVPIGALIGMRRSFAGSNIGGIRETQEMLDFCAEHGIGAEVEVIPAEPARVDEAYERVVASDVRYRFVIDLGTLTPTS